MEAAKKGSKRQKKLLLKQVEGQELKINSGKVSSYQSKVVAEAEDPLCLTQATIGDFNIFTQGNNLELHKIDEAGNFKKICDKALVDNAENEIAPKRLVMYDQDTKAMIAHNGGICNMDIERMEIIEKYVQI